MLSTLIFGFTITFMLMSLLWLIQRQTGNAAIIDLGWTLSVPMLHWLFWWNGAGSQRSLLLCLLVSIWGLRLGGYLFLTRLLPGMPEEGRYQQLRKEWGDKFQSKIFGFYQIQALASLFLVGVFLPVHYNPAPGISLTEVLGAALFVVGLLGVALSDHQLNVFKKQRTEAEKGAHQVCQLGLWNYSRHPNYFFESVLWFGMGLFAQASPGGWIAMLAPLTILHLVLNVTGIPPTEAQAVRSKGQAYLDYQQSTSAFVPWFKKRVSR
jgi:steroid 5-alpha reductase family enzyme